MTLSLLASLALVASSVSVAVPRWVTVLLTALLGLIFIALIGQPEKAQKGIDITTQWLREFARCLVYLGRILFDFACLICERAAELVARCARKSWLASGFQGASIRDAFSRLVCALIFAAIAIGATFSEIIVIQQGLEAARLADPAIEISSGGMMGSESSSASAGIIQSIAELGKKMMAGELNTLTWAFVLACVQTGIGVTLLWKLRTEEGWQLRPLLADRWWLLFHFAVFTLSATVLAGVRGFNLSGILGAVFCAAVAFCMPTVSAVNLHLAKQYAGEVLGLIFAAVGIALVAVTGFCLITITGAIFLVILTIPAITFAAFFCIAVCFLAYLQSAAILGGAADGFLPDIRQSLSQATTSSSRSPAFRAGLAALISAALGITLALVGGRR